MSNKATNPKSCQDNIIYSPHRKKLIYLCGTLWLKANNLYDLKDKIINSKEYLPNIEGFKFISLHKDGSLTECIVKKDEKGMHYIDNYEDIIGWFCQTAVIGT